MIIQQLDAAGLYVVECIKQCKDDYTQKFFSDLFKHALPKEIRHNKPYCNTTDELLQAVATSLSRAEYFHNFILFSCFDIEQTQWHKGNKSFEIDWNTLIAVKQYIAIEAARIALNKAI